MQLKKPLRWMEKTGDWGHDFRRRHFRDGHHQHQHHHPNPYPLSISRGIHLSQLGHTHLWWNRLRPSQSHIPSLLGGFKQSKSCNDCGKVAKLIDKPQSVLQILGYLMVPPEKKCFCSTISPTENALPQFFNTIRVAPAAAEQLFRWTLTFECNTRSHHAGCRSRSYVGCPAAATEILWAQHVGQNGRHHLQFHQNSVFFNFRGISS